MATYDIESVLHPTNRDISPSGVISRDFRVPSSTIVRIEGTLTDPWDVESKVGVDVTDNEGNIILAASDSVWTSETEAFYDGSGAGKPGATLKQLRIDGNPNMLYRINLGNNSPGAIGLIYQTAERRYQ